ncbi:hypothetical protein [Microbulbifer guangxiensis]|nr:hypothetical protein [Microbulbifer guangxiensis]
MAKRLLYRSDDRLALRRLFRVCEVLTAVIATIIVGLLVLT